MEYNRNDLEWLFRTFDRMRHNCIKAEFENRSLLEASHPLILFTLRYEMKDMTASQKEIGDAIGISPPTVAISIKRMEKTGLVHKVSDETDLRRNLITLTEKGMNLVEECSLAFNKIARGMFEGFSETERAQLKEFYIRMIQNLESMGVQSPAQLKRRNQE